MSEREHVPDAGLEVDAVPLARLPAPLRGFLHRA